MQYLIEATSNVKVKDYENITIPVQVNVDGERENTSIVFDLGGGKNWWIPLSELSHLMNIINLLTE